MRRPSKPGPDATLPEILGYVARHPSLYPAFACALVRHVYAKGRFYLMCWRAGYRVSTVRRLAREARQ
ncbi:hypothetical protein [Acidiphilium multivorum]|jgi:hypothetical protein|uniref:hypothetical protein n=1 Tax=Acidiphilium multivorum TaxID=62140 RepID=UPI001B8AB643|nr:hypothetical protein [Acidiphilium multivorum]MBS3023293.1 hypothetical protein [Acidiphilium multivorum]